MGMHGRARRTTGCILMVANRVRCVGKSQTSNEKIISVRCVGETLSTKSDSEVVADNSHSRADALHRWCDQSKKIARKKKFHLQNGRRSPPRLLQDQKHQLGLDKQMINPRCHRNRLRKRYRCLMLDEKSNLGDR